MLKLITLIAIMAIQTEKVNINLNSSVETALNNVQFSVTEEVKEKVVIEEPSTEEAIIKETIAEEKVDNAVVEELKAKKTKEVPYTGFIENMAGAKNSLLKKMDNYYTMIPENTRKFMEEKGWRYVVLNHKDLMATAGVNYSILGYTDIENRVIYLDNREKAKDTILHEFAHAVDYEHEFYCSFGEEWNAIYAAEKDIYTSFHSTHKNNTSTEFEYFAEAFSTCITNPQTMIDNCPATYNYIMNIMNNL